MKKRIIAISTIATLAISINAADTANNQDLAKQVSELKAKLAKLEKKIKKVDKKARTARMLANGNHIKWDVDFRTTVDQISYEMGDGKKYTNNAVLANRLYLNMKYDAGDKVRFYGTLAWNKLYGQNLNSQSTNYNNQFDWVVNENANGDGNLRVKEAYWLYANDTFLGKDISWTASIGRRPSVDGLGINYREGNPRKSAIASTVNVEFDGLSLRWNLDQVIPLEGSWIKLCAGRGLTSAKPRFSNDGTDYAKDSNYINSDMVGLIFVPYDNGQYSLHTNYAKANGLIGDADGNISTSGFTDFGDLELSTILFKAEGIGDGINDFLDDTIFFASYSTSKTTPKGNMQMLGSSSSKTGNSYWIGIQMPCPITEDGRLGVEYNHGSKYWRSMTYGEDTMIGSKIAVRGSATEIYWIKPITNSLSINLRHTQINYDYSGSNAFFGVGGKPYKTSSNANAVEKATDTRISLRYKF